MTEAINRDETDWPARALGGGHFTGLAKRDGIQRLLIRFDGPGRAVRHRLSKEGEAAYRAGACIVDGILAESIGSLTVDERASLHAMLTKAASGLA